jgi:signal peptidase I
MTEPDAAPPDPSHPGRFPEAPKRGRGTGSFLAELPVLILIAFVLALLMKTFLVQAFFIPSSSMEPTLEINDRVLVNKLSTRYRDPQRGEVVVFSEASVGAEEGGNPVSNFLGSLASGLGLAPPAEKDFIKRIIGLPGETIEMRDGVIQVDGRPLPEDATSEGGYLSARHYSDFGPVSLGPDEYFMMGDNRPSSADSRVFGPIPSDQIIGRAFVIIWPFGRLDTLPIPDYDAEAGAAESSQAGAGPLALAA